MDEQIRFKNKAYKVGGSTAIVIPPELIKHLNINEGDELTITANTGKHGRFLAIWKEK